MRARLVILGTIISLTSCQNQEKGKGDSLERSSTYAVIDTVSVITSYNIQENFSKIGLSSESVAGLSEQIDTLELTYHFGFCDCQNWILSEIWSRAKNEHNNIAELDPRGQIEFNLDSHAYYIEPADSTLEVNWRVGVNGTTIRFIGREYVDNKLPRGRGFTVPDPPLGKVFRYYSYEILKPYRIWGPHKFIEIDPISGDSINETIILTVE